MDKRHSEDHETTTHFRFNLHVLVQYNKNNVMYREICTIIQGTHATLLDLPLGPYVCTYVTSGGELTLSNSHLISFALAMITQNPSKIALASAGAKIKVRHTLIDARLL